MIYLPDVKKIKYSAINILLDDITELNGEFPLLSVLFEWWFDDKPIHVELKERLS